MTFLTIWIIIRGMVTTELQSKPGRPTSLTPYVQESICKSLREGLYLNRACHLAGIDESTFHKWRKDAEEGKELYIEFFKSLKRAEAEHQQEKLAQIAAAGKKAHYWGAAAWQLERRYKSEYALAPQPGSDTPQSITIKVELVATRQQPRVIEGKAEVIQLDDKIA